MSSYEQKFNEIQNKLNSNGSPLDLNFPNKTKYIAGIIVAMIAVFLIFKPKFLRNNENKFDIQKFIIWSLLLSFIIVAIFYHSYFY